MSLPPLSLPAPPSPPRSARVVVDTPEGEGRGAASEGPASLTAAVSADDLPRPHKKGLNKMPSPCGGRAK